MADTVVKLKTLHGDGSGGGGGITQWLEACSSRVNLIDGYLNRVVKQDYINTQSTRFENENVGDDFGGGKWARLDKDYATYKAQKFAGYPGGGTKLNVRASNLLQSLLLKDTYYASPEPKKIRAGRKGKASTGAAIAGSLAVVDAASIHIYTLVPYAEFVDEKRTFTDWSQHFWDRTNRGIMDYLAGKGKI